MKCQKCNLNEATIHFTKIIMGQKQEFHFCEHCIKDNANYPSSTAPYNYLPVTKNYAFYYPSTFDTGSLDFDVTGFITGLFSNMLNDLNAGSNFQNPVRTVCVSCGITFDEFLKNGKLGCTKCYDIFHDKLVDALKKIHGNVVHTGKFPAKLGSKIKVERKIKLLQDELTDAIKKEDYEKAAIIRDKIKLLNESKIAENSIDEINNDDHDDEYDANEKDEDLK